MDMTNLQKVNSYGQIPFKVILIVLVVILGGGLVYTSVKLWSEKRNKTGISEYFSGRKFFT